VRELRGKVAVVTGGASGIGLALGRAFAAEGMRVALLDVHGERLATAGREVEGSLAVHADTTRPDDLRRAADAVLQRFGGVHVVAANAGISGRASTRLWEESEEDWRRVVDVNLHGSVNTLRAFVPLVLRNGEGHVLVTSSMAGVSEGATQAGYWATKHALVSLTETLRLQLAAIEHGSFGATVLLPGSVATNLGESRVGDVPRGAGVPGWSPGDVDATEVASCAVAALRDGRRYVFTHPNGSRRVRARVDAVLADLRAFEEGGPPSA
jgi:NAD(P)-dependent dehydrogenase (short-subunit alcohol dehydrogenase family)